jgi:Tfp pilus assembly protein PilW
MAIGPSRTQTGQSLPGLLVGLALGLLVVAAAVRMLGLQLQLQTHQRQAGTVQQDLQSALDLMGQELMQAHYLQSAWQVRLAAPCTDALCSNDGAMRVGPTQIEFAHDRNRNGLRENNECSGFRLRAGELQHKTACQPVVWTSITDAGSLRLTALQFALQCQRQGQRLMRRVQVQISGHPPGQPLHPLQLRRVFGVRNDLPTDGSDCP